MNHDALLSPLVEWADGLYGLCWQFGAQTLTPDDTAGVGWEEIRAELRGDEWTIEYAPDEVQGWEIYRGRIPSNEFLLSLLRNGSCGSFGCPPKLPSCGACKLPVNECKCSEAVRIASGYA